MNEYQVDFELEIPDISWDTGRTYPPTATSQPSPPPPSFDPTPVPSPHPTLAYPSYVPTPAPLLSRTSAPVTLAPITFKPSYTFYRLTLAPTTQDIATLSPVAPSPVTPSPASSPVTTWPVTTPQVTPSPVAPSPVTQSPTVTSSESLAPSPSTASISETSKSPSSLDEARTYYSCHPPPTETVQYGTTLVDIEPQISNVGIPYGFQVQVSEDEDIKTILPSIESHLESTLGEYMRSHTEDGYDKNQCGGYYVEDFSLRKLTNNTLTGVEDAPTKIVAISRAKSMYVDENQQCEPPNENCYVVYGGLEATYVGNNEAGVTSSISRVIKEEVVQQSDYDIQYKPVDDETYGYVSPDTSNKIPVVVSSAQDAEPESIIESSRITPYGKIILVALGSAFIVLCFILFTKGIGSKKTKKNSKRETKNANNKSLGGDDDLKQLDEEDSCYDLESVMSFHDKDSEGGFEVKSPRKFGLFGSANAATATATATAAASVAVGSVASCRDSVKTEKWRNKSDDSAKVAATAATASAVVEESADNSRDSGKRKIWWGKADDGAKVAATAAAAAATASAVAVNSVDSTHDSGKTNTWWNKADNSDTVACRAKVATAIGAVDSVASSYDSTKTKKLSNKESDILKYDSLVAVETVDEESCMSDRKQALNAVPPPEREREAGYQFLPSLPNFRTKGGGTPLVDRLPSTLSETSNGSRASQKSSGLSRDSVSILPSLPIFLTRGGDTPLVDRLPSTLSEISNGSRASQKSPGLSRGSGLTGHRTPKPLNPTTNRQLPPISEASFRPSKIDTPRVSFAQLPRTRHDSPSGFTRCSSRVSKYEEDSVETECAEGEI